MSLVSSPFFFSSASTGFYPFEPTGSLRFEDGDNPRLQRTPTTSGNRKTWTFACWFKVGNQGSLRSLFSVDDSSAGQYVTVNLTSSDYMYLQVTDGSAAYYKQTNRVFRDSSAWYHLVWSVDTTQSTATDRVKVYINGEEETSFSTSQNPSLNANTDVNHTLQHQIGNTVDYTRYFDGYMAEIYLIDGTAHDADAFGELKNGVWVPKDAKGSLTFGTNGFYLPFNSTVVSEGQSTVLYEGTGGSRSVEGFGYKPDLVWWKSRNGANSHVLHDRVRGPNRMIRTNLTNAETDGDLSAFSSDGFFTTNTVDNGNYSGETYAAWAWDAGADQTSTGFGCVAYHGDGSANRPVRDVGFKPDLVWVKTRDAANDHNLFDSVRGATKRLRPSGTNAEATDTNSVVSFDDDGFTVGTNADYNGSSNDYVAWCWDAGDDDAVSNTDGDITSTVKASTTHGFSITSFTGNGSADQTVGHGLSSAPEFIILKDRDSNSNNDQWQISSSHIGDKYGYFTTAAFAAGAAMKPTSGDDTTFTTGIGPNQGVINTSNESGDKYIAYLWNSVSGYSKFGTYTGNGSATGPTVTLGFRPALVLRKRTDDVGDWVILDTTRDNFNNADTVLSANKSNADTTVSADAIEVTSTGFQIKGTGAGTNANGGTYFYAAFAGGLDTIAPVNTDGDIDSRVKASDETGFSIIRGTTPSTVTGFSFGHGLASAPDWIVYKEISGTANWQVYHKDLTASSNILQLNSSAGESSGSYWGTIDSDVISLQSGLITAANNDFICYAWKATTGKSAFGSYTGNGSASGPSVTGLGFKPSLIIFKRADAANNWMIQDTLRDSYGTVDNRLYPNLSNAEDTGGDYGWTADSDGFTIKTSEAGWNANGGTYIYMAFANGRDASFFHDESGQGNNFEPENLDYEAVVSDAPTDNFPTWNPLDKSSDVTLYEGNLRYSFNSRPNSRTVRATVALPSSGKYYWEFQNEQASSNPGRISFGIVKQSESTSYNTNPGTDSGYINYSYGGGIQVEGTSIGTAGSYYNTERAAIAVDCDSGKFWFGKVSGQGETVWYNSTAGTTGDPVAGSNPVTTLSDPTEWLPFGGWHEGGSGSEFFSARINFGQDPFLGTIPEGYQVMSTANLPDPAIDPAASEEPADYFNTVTYSGNNTQLSVTGVGFQSDWTWIKKRNGAASHVAQDSVRGSFRYLSTDSNAAENTNSANDWFRSFDSDGFTVSKTTTGGTATTEWNNSGDTYVAWNWLAGGSAVSNTDGATTSSVSANTKAGFSIVSYIGSDAGGSGATTVGHGLDSAPELIITKNRDNTSDWRVYSSVTGNANALLLNSTAASGGTSSWNSTSPTSSVFSSNIYDGDEIVAYCFHSVEGYSKIGSYTGNGSSNGAFVHCGFKPAWVMIKRTDAADHWGIEDIKRSTYNEVNATLYANLTNAEYTGGIFGLDFVSNGFKLRTTDGMYNASGGSYIYLAYADNPFKYASAR